MRYWNLNNPKELSYYINTPNNDECSYFSEIISGGVQMIQEKVSRTKNFPSINANMLHGTEAKKLKVPNS